MREKRYAVDTRVRHLSPRGPPPRHREYSPRRGRDRDKYSREDERSRRIERRDGFDRDLNLQGGKFYDTVDRVRHGAGPRCSRSPWRSERRDGFDRGRSPRDGRFSDTVDRDRYGIGPRRSRSPRRIEKRDGFDGDLKPRAGRFSDNLDRDRYGIGPRRSRSPRRIEKRDSFGVDLNPRAGSFVEAVDKDRYGVGSRRSRSPQRIDGRDDFDGDLNLQAGRFPDSVGRDRCGFGSWYSRSPRRFGERDVFKGDLSLQAGRFSGTMDRDRFGVGTRHSRSPGRIEKRDNFALDMNPRGSRFSCYDNRDRGKYGVGVESPRMLYGEDLRRGDSNSSKFEFGHLLDVPRKSDGLNVNYSSYKNDNHGVGDDNITTSRGGGESENYPKKQYFDASLVGMSSVSHHLVTKPVFSEHDKGGRFYSDSDTLAHGSVGGVTEGAGDVSTHLPSVVSRYLNTDTDKQRYFNLRNECQLEKRDGEFRDQGEHRFGTMDKDVNFKDGLYLDKLGIERPDKQRNFNLRSECQLEKRDGEFRDQGEHRFGTMDKDVNFKDGLYLDKLGIERPVGREMYENKEGDNLVSSQVYLKGNSDYMVSSSRSKDYIPMSSGILNESFPGHSTVEDIHPLSHGIQAGTGLVSDAFAIDGYNEILRHMSPSRPGSRFDDIKSKSRLYVGLPEQKHKDSLYPEFGGSTKPRDFVEEYGVQHMSRFGLLDSVDETSHLNHMGDDRLGDKHPSSLRQSTSNNFVAYGSPHPRNQDLDILGSGSLYLNFEREKYRGRGSTRLVEYDEVHDGPRSLAERSDVFPTKDDSPLGRVCGSQRNGLDLADLRFVEPSQRRSGGEYPLDNILYEHNNGIRISTDGSGARKIYNHLDAGDDVEPASFLEGPGSSRRKLEKSKREAREIISNKFSSQFITSRSSDPHTSGSRVIKNRLGSVPRKLHVSQRLIKKKKPSVKKRLAPAPSKKHATLPWLKSRSSKKVPNMQDDSNGNHRDQGGDLFPLAEIEPPEKSEDFKQLVHSAFFKFLKQINETPGKIKKYIEPGKDGCLKCIVCSSNSNEFVDTKSLARHAFTSEEVGIRSQHLGFYQALCVVMGWKIAEEPSSDWHCEVMSNAEISALKEDLIIWPPVIIVHDCSVDDKKTIERVTVSTDRLDAKLRDMGIGSILKISNGKPSNQSVMVIKFNGTLSGLQEAERLHQRYVENKHGRLHLKQLKSSKKGSSSGDTPVVPAADQEEAFLYGYLGIAEDLDKLDSDTKKRCVVKSKKEILSIVKASLDTNAENESFKG